MTVLTRITVQGLCGSDCVAAVTRALKTVPDAGRFTVELRGDGTSVVSLHSNVELDDAAVRQAVTTAGFTCTGIEVIPDALVAQMREQARTRAATDLPATGCGCANPECACTCGGTGSCGGTCGCPGCKCPPVT